MLAALELLQHLHDFAQVVDRAGLLGQLDLLGLGVDELAFKIAVRHLNEDLSRRVSCAAECNLHVAGGHREFGITLELHGRGIGQGGPGAVAIGTDRAGRSRRDVDENILHLRLGIDDLRLDLEARATRAGCL